MFLKKEKLFCVFRDGRNFLTDVLEVVMWRRGNFAAAHVPRAGARLGAQVAVLFDSINLIKAQAQKPRCVSSKV
jgi:hypothetical protein